MKRIFLLLMLTISVATMTAGDIAHFINLGFSNDSQSFLFGVYGIRVESSQAYAELYFVDVDKNIFYKDANSEKLYSEDIVAGQNGLGAMLNLLQENHDKIIEYDFNHLLTGRLVYILLNGHEPESELKFRDFIFGNNYEVKLIQESFGEGEEISASFYISLGVTNSNNTRKDFSIGLPDYKRAGVKSYKIRQVLFSPDETSLIFVIEKTLVGDNGNNVRYMVETVKIQ